MITLWGKRDITREDVVAYLKSQGRKEEFLEYGLQSFGGKTGEDYAYTHGWKAVAIILKRIFE